MEKSYSPNLDHRQACDNCCSPYLEPVFLSACMAPLVGNAASVTSQRPSLPTLSHVSVTSEHVTSAEGQLVVTLPPSLQAVRAGPMPALLTWHPMWHFISE